MGLIPESGRSSGGGNGNTTPVFLPRKFQGQRSLEGYNPWGHKEPDTTESTHNRSELFLSKRPENSHSSQ